jgi:hypothetical protein
VAVDGFVLFLEKDLNDLVFHQRFPEFLALVAMDGKMSMFLELSIIHICEVFTFRANTRRMTDCSIFPGRKSGLCNFLRANQYFQGKAGYFVAVLSHDFRPKAVDHFDRRRVNIRGDL